MDGNEVIHVALTDARQKYAMLSERTQARSKKMAMMNLIGSKVKVRAFPQPDKRGCAGGLRLLGSRETGTDKEAIARRFMRSASPPRPPRGSQLRGDSSSSLESELFGA